jgi:hypothetical protein
LKAGIMQESLWVDISTEALGILARDVP